MEAINFIKKYHKEYIGEIDYSVLDNNNHNYNYYYQLLKAKNNESLILILDNNKLIVNDIEYNDKQILNNNEIFYRNMYFEIQNEDVLITNKQHIKNILESKNNKKRYNNYCYCEFINKNNEYKININGEKGGGLNIYVFILSNNNIEKLTINNNFTGWGAGGTTNFYNIIDVFIENIPSLTKINCPYCKIINYSNNILNATITHLFDCINIKKIKYIDYVDDGNIGSDKQIKISDIITKYPNLKELKLDLIDTNVIFDKSINLNKLYIHILYNYLEINDNCDINCNNTIINIIDIIDTFNKNINFINYFSKSNLTIKYGINDKNIYDKELINNLKKIKEKINCNKLIIPIYKYKSYTKFNEKYNVIININEMKELLNNIFNYNEILFINK